MDDPEWAAQSPADRSNRDPSTGTGGTPLSGGQRAERGQERQPQSLGTTLNVVPSPSAPPTGTGGCVGTRHVAWPS
jgi:hypothetical protein